jgi:hypothetical protein
VPPGGIRGGRAALFYKCRKRWFHIENLATNVKRIREQKNIEQGSLKEEGDEA